MGAVSIRQWSYRDPPACAAGPFSGIAEHAEIPAEIQRKLPGECGGKIRSSCMI